MSLARSAISAIGGRRAAIGSGPSDLRKKLWRAERRARLRALGLIAPVLALVLIFFVFPIGEMLLRSVDNRLTPEILPRTVKALADWEPEANAPPGEEAYAALIEDLREAFEAKTHSKLGVRLNYEKPGLASLFRKTPRHLAQRDEVDAEIAEKGARAVLVAIDMDWGDPALWRLLKRLSSPYTSGYYLAALDREIGPDGEARLKPEGRRVYLDLFGATLSTSALITALTLLLGYPVAYLLASLPARRANLLMILVLLPFWTSILARTSAWQVLLQTEGVLNDALVATGLNAALLAFFGLFGAPETSSLCRNDLGQILASGTLAGGEEVLRQMAARIGVQELSSCALEAIAALRAEGTEAALRVAAELDAAGRASGFGDERFRLTENRTGVVIAMTHILLPFMILPLYAVMKTIPPDYVRAARSLGASGWTAFRRVYFPCSMPGVGAGAALVFILSAGYYITPEILGGADGRFISNQIAHHVGQSLNWGLAAALAALLLAAALALYALYSRLVGFEKLRLG